MTVLLDLTVKESLLETAQGHFLCTFIGGKAPVPLACVQCLLNDLW